MKASDDDEKEASEESDKEEVMVIDSQEEEVSDNSEQNTSGLNTTGMTEVVDGMMANVTDETLVDLHGLDISNEIKKGDVMSDEKVTEIGDEKVMGNGDEKVTESDETFKKPRYLGVPRAR